MTSQVVNPALLPQLGHDGINKWVAGPTLRTGEQKLGHDGTAEREASFTLLTEKLGHDRKPVSPC